MWTKEWHGIGVWGRLDWSGKRGGCRAGDTRGLRRIVLSMRNWEVVKEGWWFVLPTGILVLVAIGVLLTGCS